MMCAGGRGSAAVGYSASPVKLCSIPTLLSYAGLVKLCSIPTLIMQAYVYARVGDHPECITVWCALDDCGEHNGTIYILPADASGKRTLVEHTRDPETKDRVRSPL